MGKTLLYKLFGVGRISKKLRPVLEAEGLQVWDEGIGGRISMKHLKAPGKRFLYRTSGFSGFLAFTGKRILAYAYGRPIINLSFDHPHYRDMTFSLSLPERLDVTFESSLFNPDWKGRIKVSFKTEKAPQFANVLQTRARSYRQGTL